MTDIHDADAPTNRLADESSPYLLLHRANPVDWYPWGDEALSRAREEDRPIFLSVGYSTCYWCHVMERESFSDAETAALMNRHFVNIKVDREERPDIDEIYMVATQILTGQGGWPNSVFLTPDLKPFFAGTYFPPEDRYGRPSFRSVIRGLAEAWQSRRGEIAEQSDDMAAEMEKALESRFYKGDAPTSPKAALAAASSLERRFDREWGGFSQAPKFPTPSNLYLLHELAVADGGADGGGDEKAAEMLRVTLDRMARGGIYDQLAGGFHRYATDREWNIPHFEKMLYDNGFLLELYAREHARTGEPEWARIVRETAAFLEREMTSPEGAFYSAIDAETDGHEGAYYVWTREELGAALGEEDAVFLAPILGFDRPPFFEEDHYVLHLARPLAELAEERRMSREELLAEVRPLEGRLLAVRDGRDRPATDDKVLTDWNGIAITGLATAGRLLDDEGMVEQAARAARFLLRELRPAGGATGGTLLHSWRAGEGRIPAYLADYAFLIRGLLALDAARPDDGWLEAAKELTAEQERRLWDPDQGGYFVAETAPDLLFRSKDVFDGATPSANAVAALNLLELADRTGDESYRRLAAKVLQAFEPVAEKYAEGVKMLTVAAWRYGGGEAGLRGEGGGEGERSASSASPGPASEAEKAVASTLEVGEAVEGRRPFNLRLTVAPGWHIQANPASAPELIATRVEARDGEVRGVEYPQGTALRAGFAAEEIQVYEGELEIRGEMTEGARLVLTYQPCDEARCLPEVRREISGS